MKIEIKTNHHYRPLITWDDLSKIEKEEFDYLKTDDDRYSSVFFRYKSNVYDISQFSDWKDTYWHAYQSETYFSGILIKYSEFRDKLKVATYYS